MGKSLKKMLKSGQIVETNNGERFLVLKDCYTKLYGHQKICFVSEDGFLTGDDYNKKLKQKYKGSGIYNIRKIYNFYVSPKAFNTIKDMYRVHLEEYDGDVKLIYERGKKIGYDLEDNNVWSK